MSRVLPARRVLLGTWAGAGEQRWTDLGGPLPADQGRQEAGEPTPRAELLGLPNPETGEGVLAPRADLLGLCTLETGEPAPQADLLGLPAPETGEGVLAPQATLLGLPAPETGEPTP